LPPISRRLYEKQDFDTGAYNIWYMDRTEKGRSEPEIVGEPVNRSENATCPSLTKDGTIYLSKRFSGKSEKIFRSRLVNGRYQEKKTDILPATVPIFIGSLPKSSKG
jgi:hypothetical protein